MRVYQLGKEGEKVGKNRGSSICRQLLANVFADCVCAVLTHQLKFATFSLPCEGRLKCPPLHYRDTVVASSASISGQFIRQRLADIHKLAGN